MTAEFERTPEERFEGLPDHPFDAHYREFAGLRLAHSDTGDGPPVVFVHGEPTWSFLWRKVIPPVRDAGFRCIAPDLPGFGRSDKPTDIDWYSYDRHTDALASLFEELDLKEATLVVHDWGGPIGLRVAVENPDRVSRIAILNTGIVTGKQRMTDAWIAFRDFVERTEDLPIGMLIRGACGTEPAAEVVAAYEAPFHNAASKAGARAFPLLMPTTPDAPGAQAGSRTATAMEADGRPKLVIWGSSDPIMPLESGRILAERFGNGYLDHVVEGGGHFLQEDAGTQIGELIANWLRSGPAPRAAKPQASR